MAEMVVMEARERTTSFWAWCTVGEGPGIESMVLTRTDGITPVTDIDFAKITLGPVLFRYPIADPPAPDPRPVWHTFVFDLGRDDEIGAAVEEYLFTLGGLAGILRPEDMRVDVDDHRWLRRRRVHVTLYAPPQQPPTLESPLP